MPFHVVALVLFAALLHAIWNALLKSSDDKLGAQGLVVGGAGLFGLAMLPFVPVPDPASWVWLALSTTLHLTYSLMLAGAYRAGHLSHFYPISRGLAPPLVAVGAWLAAGETLSATGITGLLVTSAGIVALGVFGGSGRRPGDAVLHTDPHSLKWAVGTGTVIALYSVIDGLGVRASGSAAAYGAWLWILEAVLMLPLLFAIRGARQAEAMRRQWVRGLLAGAIAAVAYGLVLWALSLGAIAGVIALREISVVFAAVIGVMIFGEGRLATKLGPAIAIAGGLIILHGFP